MKLTCCHCQIRPDPVSLMIPYQQSNVVNYGMNLYFGHMDNILRLLCYRFLSFLLECITDGECSARHDSGDCFCVSTTTGGKSVHRPDTQIQDKTAGPCPLIA